MSQTNHSVVYLSLKVLMKVAESIFGTLPDGRTVHRYDLSNAFMIVSLIDYGATIISVKLPDKKGNLEEITLNHESLDGVLHKNSYFGCTVGRIANRVANATFDIEGKSFQLAANNGPNHLHGGEEGFDKKLWEAASLIRKDDVIGVQFSYKSPDGDEGYPGNLHVQATYSLSKDNRLEMSFTAETDATTPVALTNHAYWNLSGNSKKKIYEHVIRVGASHYLVLGDNMIPTGEFRAVESTDFDLRQDVVLGERIPKVDGGGKPGFDHCFAVENYEAVDKCVVVSDIKDKARWMACLSDPESGRVMNVYGTQPGIQIYTANFLSEDPADFPLLQHNAVCLETEFYPNAINDPSMGVNILLKPGEKYQHYTVHSFSLA